MKNKIIDSNISFGYWPTLKETVSTIEEYIKNQNISLAMISFDGSEIVREEIYHRRLFSQIIGFKKSLEINQKINNTKIVLWVRPNCENNTEEVKNFINNYRELISGIKINPSLSDLNILDRKYIEYFRIAERYNFPIIFESKNDNFSNLSTISTCAKFWPHLTFLLSIKDKELDIDKLINLLIKNPNIYLSTTNLKKEYLLKLISLKLSQKIIFSSCIANKNSIEQIDAITDLINNNFSIDDHDYQLIMHRNASKIFNLKI